MRIRDDDSFGEPEFSMAPLIDVVFQLLIFFMVATTYTNKEKELGLDLPATESGSTSDAPSELVINIFRDGRMTLGGRAITGDDLPRALEGAAEGKSDVAVMIRGDRLVAHENVVAVLDACGIAGLSNLSVGTIDR